MRTPRLALTVITMGNPRTAAIGLYVLAVIVRVLTWSGTSAAQRSADVVLLLLTGAIVAAILSVGYRKSES